MVEIEISNPNHLTKPSLAYLNILGPSARDPNSVHNRTRLTDFNPGLKVQKSVFNIIGVSRIFFYRNLKNVTQESAKKELGCP